MKISKTYLEHFYNLFSFELLRVVYYTVGQYDIFLHIVHKVVDVELLLLLPMLRLFALSLSIRGGTGYFARHFKLLKLNFSQHNLVLKLQAFVSCKESSTFRNFTGSLAHRQTVTSFA